MTYWLFQGNPKYYRILDAIQELQEMPWPVTRHGKNMALGDGVLIWMSGPDAGIYAVAEIIALPEILTELPDQKYWVDTTRSQGKMMAKIRYIRKFLGQPLRKLELRQDPILKNLLVLKVPNGTNFKVTLQEWERVYDLKG